MTTVGSAKRFHDRYDSASSRRWIAVAEAAAVRVGCTSQKSVCLESVVYGKVRHVLAHRVSERTNRSRRGPRGRLEKKRCPVHAIDDPRMLAIDLRPIAIDHTAHTE